MNKNTRSTPANREEIVLKVRVQRAFRNVALSEMAQQMVAKAKATHKKTQGTRGSGTVPNG